MPATKSNRDPVRRSRVARACSLGVSARYSVRLGIKSCGQRQQQLGKEMAQNVNTVIVSGEMEESSNL